MPQRLLHSSSQPLPYEEIASFCLKSSLKSEEPWRSSHPLTTHECWLGVGSDGSLAGGLGSCVPRAAYTGYR